MLQKKSTVFVCSNMTFLRKTEISQQRFQYQYDKNKQTKNNNIILGHSTPQRAVLSFATLDLHLIPPGEELDQVVSFPLQTRIPVCDTCHAETATEHAKAMPAQEGATIDATAQRRHHGNGGEAPLGPSCSFLLNVHLRLKSTHCCSHGCRQPLPAPSGAELALRRWPFLIVNERKGGGGEDRMWEDER